MLHCVLYMLDSIFLFIHAFKNVLAAYLLSAIGEWCVSIDVAENNVFIISVMLSCSYLSDSLINNE